MKPWAMEIWDLIKMEMDKQIKSTGRLQCIMLLVAYVTVCGSEVYLNSCTIDCVYCDVCVGQILYYIISVV